MGYTIMICKPCGCAMAIMAEDVGAGFLKKKLKAYAEMFPVGVFVQYVDDDVIREGEFTWMSECTHTESAAEFLKDIGVDPERLPSKLVDRMAIYDAVKAVQS